jgi:hypothetical protein
MLLQWIITALLLYAACGALATNISPQETQGMGTDMSYFA